MFLRETIVKREGGKTDKYLHLVESRWDSSKKSSTHKLVYSFGHIDSLNRKRLTALACNILAYLKEDTDTLNPSNQIIFSRPFGIAYLVRNLADKLCISSVLKSQLKKRKFEAPLHDAILGMLINRCSDPLSKRAVDEWLEEDIWFPPAERLQLHHYYRGLDFLEECKDYLENELFWQTRNLLNRKVDLVFYDTTSTYAEGKGESDLLDYGYSRDHRPDRKQIVVGLATDSDGLPLASSVFQGNTMDMDTVEAMLKRVKRFKVGRCIFVCDRGMVSEGNLKLMREHEYDYLVGVKLRGLVEVRDKVLSTRGRYHKIKDNMEVKEAILGDKRYIICLNPDEAKKDRVSRENLVQKLQEEIGILNHGRASPCNVITHPIKKRFVKELKSGKLVLDKSAIRAEARYDGKYVLLTTDRKLSTPELALQYKRLFHIERTFRTLKSGINLRPLYHRADDRIKAHISLCVLAHFIERYAELKTNTTWDRIAKEISRITATKILLKNGEVVKRSMLRKTQQVLLNQLDMAHPTLILEG
ncbi:MAG: IS1634 family transposase [Candidatus Hydrothermarchaeota archaeon]